MGETMGEIKGETMWELIEGSTSVVGLLWHTFVSQ